MVQATRQVIMLGRKSISSNAWWQTLMVAFALGLLTMGYYWIGESSVKGSLSIAVKWYIANWPVVTIFYLLVAISIWFRLRVHQVDERSRMMILNSTGMLSLLLGSSGPILAVGILAWHRSWPSLWAMVEAFAYPPIFIAGSSALIIAGIALTYVSWTPTRRYIFFRTSGRVILLALLGFLPVIVSLGVQSLYLPLQVVAVIGLFTFIVGLFLLLLREARPISGSEKGAKG